MTATTTSNRLEGLCRLVGVPSRDFPSLSPEIAERLLDVALAGGDLKDAAGRTMVRRKYAVTHLDAGDYDQLRRLAHRAHVKLGWLDRQIGALTTEREQLAALIGGQR
jgi:hypothetical protein